MSGKALAKTNYAMSMNEIVSLKGPIKLIDGNLVLMIPLEVGGQVLSEFAQGISEIEGSFLKIIIRDWLAAQLNIKDGSLITVDNNEGKLNIYPAS